MLNRRDFMHSMLGSAAVAIPALRDDSLDRVLSAVSQVRKSPSPGSQFLALSLHVTLQTRSTSSQVGSPF